MRCGGGLVGIRMSALSFTLAFTAVGVAIAFPIRIILVLIPWIVDTIILGMGS